MLKPPCRELKHVRARVAFKPTSQSDSDRHFAASDSGRICSSVRRFSHALAMAPCVIDCIQSRRTGLLMPPISKIYRKISSPSRPASQALTIDSTSLRLASLRICLSRGSESGIGSSWKRSGIAGKTSNFHGSFLPFGPIGMRNSTKCPTAEVMMAWSFSK